MEKLSKNLGLAQFGLQCAANAYNMWHGGNQWSSWISYLSFFRYIAKLKLDYSKFDHYEKLGMHSGPRIMHAKFCIISDRPVILKVDDKNRPHCDAGPFCQWSDGAALYSIHGIRVPAYIVETKGEDLNVLQVLGETNVDVRREGLRKIPLEKIIKDTNAKVLDTWKNKKKKWCDYVLYDMDFKDGKTRRVLRMKNPSIDAEHFERVEDDITTCKQALAWRMGLKLYEEPVVLT